MRRSLTLKPKRTTKTSEAGSSSGGRPAPALAALLDDPERRARMGAAGRQRVEEMFSWRAVAVKVAAAYEQVVASWHAEGPMPDPGRKGRRTKKWSAARADR